MPEGYTSKIALLLSGPMAAVGDVVDAAVAAGDIDRALKVGDRDEAMEVHWGGRMERGVVRRIPLDEGRWLLRTEAHLARLGLRGGMQHQLSLLQGLARQRPGELLGVRDLEARIDHDEAWMHRLAIGSVDQKDAIVAAESGEGTWWVRTHGAARFDLPDLELYGLTRSQVEPARRELQHLHAQLLRVGLKGQLNLTGGTSVYLVPVLEAWQHLNLDWPGVGRAGQPRGEGLDGPRATLSVLHPPKFGRYRKDFKGVLAAL